MSRKKEKKTCVNLPSVFHPHWEGSHYKKSPRVKKKAWCTWFVCIIIVPCTLANKKKHNLGHFCSVLQNSRVNTWSGSYTTSIKVLTYLSYLQKDQSTLDNEIMDVRKCEGLTFSIDDTHLSLCDIIPEIAITLHICISKSEIR